MHLLHASCPCMRSVRAGHVCDPCKQAMRLLHASRPCMRSMQAGHAGAPWKRLRGYAHLLPPSARSPQRQCPRARLCACAPPRPAPRPAARLPPLPPAPSPAGAPRHATSRAHAPPAETQVWAARMCGPKWETFPRASVSQACAVVGWHTVLVPAQQKEKHAHANGD
eukprot:360648-Chlamydomonas_euryale.AAC.6